MAALIWQTAFSPINHNQARLGKEGDLVRKLLQDFQKRAEDAGTCPSQFLQIITSEEAPKKGGRFSLTCAAEG